MIKVLVIDDSAVMRAFLGRVVASQPDMELVAVAADPVLAIDQIRLKAPDVITLDVEMPRMNGLEFLGKLMAVRPLPVIMISSLTREGADTTLRALELGAVDFFARQSAAAFHRQSGRRARDRGDADRHGRRRRRGDAGNARCGRLHDCPG